MAKVDKWISFLSISYLDDGRTFCVYCQKLEWVVSMHELPAINVRQRLSSPFQSYWLCKKNILTAAQRRKRKAVWFMISRGKKGTPKKLACIETCLWSARNLSIFRVTFDEKKTWFCILRQGSSDCNDDEFSKGKVGRQNSATEFHKMVKKCISSWDFPSAHLFADCNAVVQLAQVSLQAN